MDTLSELAKVSESLQKDDVTLIRAYTVINRAVRAFQNMKDVPAAHVAEKHRRLKLSRQLSRHVSLADDGVNIVTCYIYATVLVH